MADANNCDRAAVGLNQNHDTIKHCPGITHPGAEHSAVGGRLMMGVVPGVLDRLGLGQPAKGQEAENKQDRENSQDAVAHQK